MKSKVLGRDSWRFGPEQHDGDVDGRQRRSGDDCSNVTRCPIRSDAGSASTAATWTKLDARCHVPDASLFVCCHRIRNVLQQRRARLPAVGHRTKPSDEMLAVIRNTPVAASTAVTPFDEVQRWASGACTEIIVIKNLLDNMA
ncbi:hypothetical protein PC129_g2640 [Phytophthora cactorum]|uniref:Uncharacterized protein n=1 Tax=Phytophthora cactorum TaxID=29920 RepID=A0A8T1IRX9_9STRA|nr:hypothetical protein PC129_g2640 [Phytophthora cactorum]KAG4250920.1 hypothetical protein PC116_g1379 [Phytophthora cactorum]